MAKSLKQQAKEAPKYYLRAINSENFLCAKLPTSGLKLCTDIDYAMEYSVGFDNPAMKLGYWNAVAKDYGIKFEIFTK